MAPVSRVFIFKLFCLFLFGFSATVTFAQDRKYYSLSYDSLFQMIPQLEGEERLSAYYGLINRFINFGDEPEDTVLKYLVLYEKEALLQNNAKYIGDAMLTRIGYYYNAKRPINELDVDGDLAFMKKNKQWDNYSMAYSTYIETLMGSNLKDRAMLEAKKYYDEAKLSGDRDVLINASYTIGRIYALSSSDEEAEPYFKLCINEKVKLSPLKMNCYFSLVNALSNQEKLDEAEKLFSPWEADIKKLEERNKGPMPVLWAAHYLLKADFYIKKKELDKATYYCKKLEEIPQATMMTSQLYYLKTYLAAESKEWSKVLEYAIKIDSMDQTPQTNMLIKEFSANALYHLGRPDEGYTAFLQTLALKDSANNIIFNKQLNELRTQYDVDKITAQKIRNRNYFLFALAGCALLAIALGIWIYYSRKIAKKNRTLAQQIKELIAQQEARDNEILAKTTFIPEKEQTEEPEDGFCPESRMDQLCIAIRDALLKDKAYRNPNLTRDDMVARMGTNRETFIEAFQFCFKMSFTDYVNNLRLKDAVSLLEQSDLSIEAISEKTGFGTIRTFQRQFQAKYNMTPKDYRKLAGKG